MSPGKRSKTAVIFFSIGTALLFPTLAVADHATGDAPPSSQSAASSSSSSASSGDNSPLDGLFTEAQLKLIDRLPPKDPDQKKDGAETKPLSDKELEDTLELLQEAKSEETSPEKAQALSDLIQRAEDEQTRRKAEKGDGGSEAPKLRQSKDGPDPATKDSVNEKAALEKLTQLKQAVFRDGGSTSSQASASLPPKIEAASSASAATHSPTGFGFSAGTASPLPPSPPAENRVAEIGVPIGPSSRPANPPVAAPPPVALNAGEDFFAKASGSAPGPSEAPPGGAPSTDPKVAPSVAAGASASVPMVSESPAAGEAVTLPPAQTPPPMRTPVLAPLAESVPPATESTAPSLVPSSLSSRTADEAYNWRETPAPPAARPTTSATSLLAGADFDLPAKDSKRPSPGAKSGSDLSEVLEKAALRQRSETERGDRKSRTSRNEPTGNVKPRPSL